MLASIHTVLFDLDGTLTVPVFDFAAIRARLEIPTGANITQTIDQMPEPRRSAKQEQLRMLELETAQLAVANTGAVELTRALASRGIATGIVTRNFPQAAALTLKAIGVHVDVVLTRECAAPKPAPDGVLEALSRLGKQARGALMVGDYLDDMLAGQAAGVRTCLVTNGAAPKFQADLFVDSPAELLGLFQAHWK